MVTLFLVTFTVVKHLTVYEKYSRHWPAVAIVSAALSVILFGSYLYIDDVLMEGYLRLAAFIFFALSLLSIFKWKDGRMEIHLSVSEGHLLLIRYLLRKEPVAEESFDLDDFISVKIDSMPDKSLYNDFSVRDYTIRLQRNDNREWIYLNDVHGRVIPLHLDTAGQITTFLLNHADLDQFMDEKNSSCN